MKEKLNILVLHWLRDPKEARDVLLKLVFFLKKYKPEHNYLYHDVSLPMPEYFKDFKFDAIILDVTLLCLRYPYHKKYFDFFMKNFDFIKNSDAVKIAFPQDDYDCSEILDNWMVDWGIDLVISPLADNPDIGEIYRKYSQIGKIELGYTGYIDNDFFDLKNKVMPFEKRKVDICYRARKLPPYFGKIGELKWRIADIVKEKTKKYDLITDISYREKDTIIGKKWYEFLGNSKFTLGSLSGSSLIDPKGEIQEKVKEYCSKKPDYTYEEVEQLFYPGMDKYNFTAISPRNIEAAFTLTGQILVEGPYSGILEPWVDYIPLKPDGSNYNEVYQAMVDKKFATQVIQNCYAKIVETKDLYYETVANKIINFIYEYKTKKHFQPENNELMFNNLLEKYNREMRLKYKAYFNYLRLRKKVSAIFDLFPYGKELKKIIKDRVL
jgi:hypothetical protein